MRVNDTDACGHAAIHGKKGTAGLTHLCTPTPQMVLPYSGDVHRVCAGGRCIRCTATSDKAKPTRSWVAFFPPTQCPCSLAISAHLAPFSWMMSCSKAMVCGQQTRQRSVRLGHRWTEGRADGRQEDGQGALQVGQIQAHVYCSVSPPANVSELAKKSGKTIAVIQDT